MIRAVSAFKRIALYRCYWRPDARSINVTQVLPTSLPRGKDQAYISWAGKRIYLGGYGTTQSRARYHDLCRQISLTGTVQLEPPENGKVTVAEVAAAYAEYRKKLAEPWAFDRIKRAIRHLVALFGDDPAISFGSRNMSMLRQVLVNATYVKSGSSEQPRRYTRTSINADLSVVADCFRHARLMQLIPEDACRGISDVRRVRRGEFELPETTKQPPPPDAHIAAIAPFVSPVIWAMVQLQQLTAMRPGEVCRMRAVDIDMSAAIWIYQPAQHKNDWRGKDRQVYLNLEAQQIIAPFLVGRPIDKRLFSAAESAAWHRAQPKAAQLNSGSSATEPELLDHCIQIGGPALPLNSRVVATLRCSPLRAGGASALILVNTRRKHDTA